MSPEGLKTDWWNREKSSRMTNTDPLIEEQSSAVKRYLDTQGYKGYSLGKPVLCGWTYLQICILDPEKEVSENILIFADNKKKTSEEIKEIKPIGKDQYQYSYDSFNEKYLLEFSIQTPTYKEQQETGYLGEFDTRGDILAIREKTGNER